MAFGFLAKIEHSVGNALHGNSSPGGGAFGFLRSAGSQLVNPAAKGANEVIAEAKLLNPAGTIKSNTASAQRQLEPNAGLLHQGGVLQGQETNRPEGLTATDLQKVAGTGAEIGSLATPELDGLKGATVASKIGIGARAGAVGGAAFNTGATATSSQKQTPFSYLKSAAEGAVGGAALGGVAPVLGTAAKVVGKGIKQIASTAKFAGETGAIGADVRPSVLQIVNNKTGTKEFKTIAPNEYNQVVNAVDGSQKSGLAGKNINGNIYHITAKAPEDMVKAGFTHTGEVGVKDLPSQLSGAAQQSFLSRHFNPDNEGGYINIGGKEEPPATPEGEQNLPANVSSPDSLTHDIQTPLGTLRITQDEMKAIQKASTPEEVKNIVGDALPAEVTNKIAPGLALAKDPNIIRNLISKGVSDTVPPPVQDIRPVVQPPAPDVPRTAADHVINALGEAQKTRDIQEQGYTAQRAERIGAAQGAGKELPGSQGYAAELSQLKGQLDKPDYQGLKGHLSPSDQEELFTHLRQEIKDNPNIKGYADINTQSALRKVIFGEGGAPTNSEIKLLKNAFGEDFGNSVSDDVMAHAEKVSAAKSFFDKAADVAGVPRTIMASADFSGGLRQGLALATRHPILFAQEFAKQFEYAFSEKEYEAANQLIHEHPDYPLLQQAKVAIQDVGDKPPSEKEEQFVSNLAHKIPVIGTIVKGSDRAYTGLLNNLRARSFYNLVASARNAGVDFEDTANQKLLKDFGTVVNTSTGRGNLGRLETAGKPLSAALFAPRLIASRLSMLDPRYYINLEPAARREALTTLASLGAVTGTILSLADMAGAQVNKDPTNADFGKIKIGDTRLDILGGYQQYLRLGAQLIEGKSTNSTTGASTELGKGIAATRWDEITSFLANKEAPVPSFVTTLLKGKDQAGNPINYQHEILSRFTPLLAQDIKDLYTHDNAVGGSSIGKPLAALGGAFGVGLQTYSAQDAPLSTKQTAYIKSLTDNGADPAEIKASTRFFQNLKEASGTRTNVNTAIDAALKKNDLPKAQQLADQYNKDLAGGIHQWNVKYGQYANQTLQDTYNARKINLSPTSINERLKAINSTKPY